MKYSIADLKAKILEMHPEITTSKLAADLTFDERKNAYLVTFKRGKEELATHIEKHDADECMNGVKCVYLGVQVAQFIKNFNEREVFERKVA